MADLYRTYYPRATQPAGNLAPHREMTGLKAWLNGARASAFRRIPPRVRVLDIGCGFGQSLDYHRRRGCDAYGVEADANVAAAADRFAGRLHVGVFSPRRYPAGFFDFVTLDQVIEHLIDPAATLAQIGRILKPGGRIIATTPNCRSLTARLAGRRWIHWHPPYHRHFFSTASLRAAAAGAGLTVSHIGRTTKSDWLQMQWYHLLAPARPGRSAPFWTRGAGPLLRNAAAGRRQAARAIGMAQQIRLWHLLTRLLDRIGLGDNLVFVLALRDRPLGGNR